MRRLETERDNLSLQVSVLNDQIDAQVEKIRDLETRSRSHGTYQNGGASGSRVSTLAFINLAGYTIIAIRKGSVCILLS